MRTHTIHKQKPFKTMKTTTHTPGPWFHTKSGNSFQIVAGSDLNGEPNELVATVHPIAHNCDYEPCEETKANARLIAAAPDLLQVVEDYVLLDRKSTRLNSSHRT